MVVDPFPPPLRMVPISGNRVHAFHTIFRPPDYRPRIITFISNVIASIVVEINKGQGQQNCIF